MKIVIRCENELCSEFDVVTSASSTFAMAPGENIYCGVCGYPLEILSTTKPLQTREFNPNAMNRTLPTTGMEFKKGPPTVHNIEALENSQE